MQTIEPPIAGKTYVSRTEPKFRLYIERVHLIDGDEDVDAGFAIEACDPRHKELMGEPGLDITDEEWAAMMAEHQFTPEE